MNCKIKKTIVKSNIKKVCWNRWKITDYTKEKLIEYYNSVNKYPDRNELEKLADQFETFTTNIKTFFQNNHQQNTGFHFQKVRTNSKSLIASMRTCNSFFICIDF